MVAPRIRFYLVFLLPLFARLLCAAFSCRQLMFQVQVQRMWQPQMLLRTNANFFSRFSAPPQCTRYIYMHANMCSCSHVRKFACSCSVGVVLHVVARCSYLCCAAKKAWVMPRTARIVFLLNANGSTCIETGSYLLFILWICRSYSCIYPTIYTYTYKRISIYAAKCYSTSFICVNLLECNYAKCAWCATICGLWIFKKCGCMWDENVYRKV